MPDWSASMQQTFEYYTVDPGTWQDDKRLESVLSSSISWDSTKDTLGSATFEMTEDIGECYVRIYLVTTQTAPIERFYALSYDSETDEYLVRYDTEIKKRSDGVEVLNRYTAEGQQVYYAYDQNGVKFNFCIIETPGSLTEKHPLGTFLVQTPSFNFNGKTKKFSVDAYTPLLELKENQPPIGYFRLKKENIMDITHQICREYVRAPIVETESERILENNFISNTEDTWLTFTKDLISNADYEFELDELGRILFAPKRDTAALQPVWTFDDGNSSILHPEVTLNRDIYEIPNVVEVVCSDNMAPYTARVVNSDPNSPISTVNRGRKIAYRVTNPGALAGITNTDRIDEYAKRLLEELSTLEYSVSYSHGYCPVRVGDCVRLNYSRAGITDVKAKVVSQNIDCKTGCTVSEQAVFTKKLWG